MAKAYHWHMYGSLVGISTTGRTNPEIKKNMPHGNPAAGGDTGGSKSPGAVSAVTGK